MVFRVVVCCGLVPSFALGAACDAFLLWVVLSFYSCCCLCCSL